MTDLVEITDDETHAALYELIVDEYQRRARPPETAPVAASQEAA